LLIIAVFASLTLSDAETRSKRTKRIQHNLFYCLLFLLWTKCSFADSLQGIVFAKKRENCSQNFQALRLQAVIHNSAMITDRRKFSAK